MLKFDCSNHQVRRAIIFGDLHDIVLELCMATTFIYGTLKRENADAAEEFKKLMIGFYADKRGTDILFDFDVLDAISGIDSGAHYTRSVKRGDSEVTEQEKVDLIGEVMALDGLSEEELTEIVSGISRSRIAKQDLNGNNIIKAVSDKISFGFDVDEGED